MKCKNTESSLLLHCHKHWQFLKSEVQNSTTTHYFIKTFSVICGSFSSDYNLKPIILELTPYVVPEISLNCWSMLQTFLEAYLFGRNLLKFVVYLCGLVWLVLFGFFWGLLFCCCCCFCCTFQVTVCSCYL